MTDADGDAGHSLASLQALMFAAGLMQVSRMEKLQTWNETFSFEKMKFPSLRGAVLARAPLDAFLRRETRQTIRSLRAVLGSSSVLGFQLVHSGEPRPAAAQSVTEACKDKRQDYQEFLLYLRD